MASRFVRAEGMCQSRSTAAPWKSLGIGEAPIALGGCSAGHRARASSVDVCVVATPQAMTTITKK